MTAQTFDFRRPPPSGFEGRVADWMNEAGKAAARVWPRVLSAGLSLKFTQVESAVAGEFTLKAADSDLGFRISCGDSTADDVLCIIPRPLLLCLVNSALGDATKELPEDRDFTPIEKPIADQLIAQLLLAPLQDAWPLDGLRLAVTQQGVPRRVSPIMSGAAVVAVTLEAAGPFGKSPIRLLLPRSEMLRKLAQSDATDEGRDQPTVEAMIGDVPTDLSVILGTVDVPLTRLASLMAGDLLILEQRVHDPLTARVGNVDRYHVWPGAVGSKQAVRVEAVIEK